MTLAQLLWLGAAVGGTSLEKPLQLTTEPTASGVSILIMGDSDVECAVEYELHVQSGKVENENRSIQRGRARLMPDRKIVVARATVASRPSTPWHARLVVEACAGASYEMTKGSGTRY